MRRYFVLSLFGLLLLITAACSESAATLPADAQGAGEAPLSALTLANFRARPNLPSQLQFLFSLRDQNGSPLTAAPDELQVQISERGGGAEAWEEIDPETSLLLHTVRNIQLEAVFVLDFTYSIARVVLSDGTDGTKTMADAFRSGATALPGPHRIGVVEFPRQKRGSCRGLHSYHRPGYADKFRGRHQRRFRLVPVVGQYR